MPKWYLHVVLENAAVGRVGGVLSKLVIPLNVRSAVVLTVGVMEVDTSLLEAARGRDGLGTGGRRLGSRSGLGGLDGLGSRGRRSLSGAGLRVLGGGVVGNGSRRRGRRRGSRLGGGRRRRGRLGSRGRLVGLDVVGRVSGDGNGDDLVNPVGVDAGGGGQRRAGDGKSNSGLHFVKVGIDEAEPKRATMLVRGLTEDQYRKRSKRE